MGKKRYGALVPGFRGVRVQYFVQGRRRSQGIHHEHQDCQQQENGWLGAALKLTEQELHYSRKLSNTASDASD
jgi:hypothetical protein